SSRARAATIGVQCLQLARRRPTPISGKYDELGQVCFFLPPAESLSMKSLLSLRHFTCFVLTAACAPLVVRAQSGMVDQVSPTNGPPPIQTAGFNGDSVSLTWQAQVRAGLSGQLEGFTLQLSGNAGATLLT